MIPKDELPATFAANLKLGSVHQGAIIAKLWNAGDSWVSSPDLNTATEPYAAGFDDAGVRRLPTTIIVHIAHLRQRLPEDFILSHTTYEYTLGAPGVLACKRILKALERAA